MRGLLPERGLLKTRGNRHREAVDVGEVGQQGEKAEEWEVALQRVRSSSAKCIGKMSTMDCGVRTEI